MKKNKFSPKKSILLNLGGGVVTDLGGFVASTFKRGIDFINIPTTLLAMVDASVGGKTGVDLGILKNQVGVINQPQMVLIFPDFLNTLDQRQLKSGFAEMLKHGLIADKDYWCELTQIDLNDYKNHIQKSVAIKHNIVEQDPTEQHVRKKLNFGHTLGHAVESYFLEHTTKRTLLHGEAIAIGMILEAYLSHKLTGMSKIELDEIKRIFLANYKKVDFTHEDIAIIIELFMVIVMTFIGLSNGLNLWEMLYSNINIPLLLVLNIVPQLITVLCAQPNAQYLQTKCQRCSS